MDFSLLNTVRERTFGLTIYESASYNVVTQVGTDGYHFVYPMTIRTGLLSNLATVPFPELNVISLKYLLLNIFKYNF